MKLKLRYIIIFGLAIILSFSCSKRKNVVNNSIPYLYKVLNDTSLAGHKALAAYNQFSTNGSIALVGSPESCIPIGEKLLTADVFDNVDGSRNPDGLPDFAGESIDSYMDLANVPYKGYLDNGSETLMREIVVRNVLFALDTLYNINSFDTENKVTKLPAKLVIITDPITCEYGKYDVDSMFHAVGKKSPVIYAAQSMFNQAFKSGKSDLNIGVMADNEVIASGAYSIIFNNIVKSKGDNSSKLHIFSTNSGSNTSVDRFLTFLDMYKNAGNSDKLDVLLIDDPLISLDSLDVVLSTIRQAATERMHSYNKLLADNFSFVDMPSAVAKDCYKYLRDKNMFTHNIAWPTANGYVSVPISGLESGSYDSKGGFEDGYKFSRETYSDTDTYTFLKYDDKYLNNNQLDMIRSKAFQTYKSYVQN